MRISLTQRLAAAAGLAVLLAGGCRPGADPTNGGEQKQAVNPATEPGREESLADNWFDTPEDLARRVVEAVRTKDVPTLRDLRVSEKLYKEELCPAFLASKPRHTMNVDFHWNLLQVNALEGMREILNRYGGQPIEYRGLEDPDEIEEYGTFRLWRRVRVRIQLEGKEKEISARLFGAIVERNGRFKLLSYVS
jgi:hypothetical protein